MKPFEDDIFNLVENIQFRQARNKDCYKVQEYLENDLKKINSSNSNISIFAEKLETFMEHRSPHMTYINTNQKPYRRLMMN
jgi:hypothetical protein